MWTLNYTDDGSYHQSEPYVGQPLAIADPNGKVTHLRYDARGNTILAKDALGNEATATYLFNDQTDSIFMPATGQNGSGTAKTSYTYAFPNGPVITTRAYDEAGTLRRTYNTLYGKEGEVLEVNGNTETLKYTYTPAYQLATFRDGKNQTTSYSYDLNGRLSEVLLPGYTTGLPDKFTYNSYDRAGNLLSMTDGRGNTSTFTYADGDRLLSQLTKAGQTISYTYDVFNRPTNVTDSTGTSSSAFDDLGAVIESTRTYTGQSAQTFGYKFYPDGSRKRMITPVGDWNYFYDVVGMCAQMTSPGGTVNYAYLDNGDLASREILNTSNSVVAFTSYQYHAAGLLKTLTNKTSSSGTTRSSYDMSAAASYDPMFNLASLSASVNGVSSQTGTATFTHDGLDRLTNEGGTRGAPMGNIAYDNASNPTTFRGTSPSYNSNNQRTGTGWVYDGNGNPTNYNSRLASFDVFDRLASLGTPPVGYTYRADGLIATRAKAVFVFDPEEGEWVEQWQPSTYFYHDSAEPVIERQSGAVTAITVRGPDGLVARKQGSTWTYYTFDQQGNVSQRLDSSGTVVSSSVYDAYGMETTNGTTPTDACGYNAQWGYWYDRDTGLYLCQARWYDPSTGRWVTRDPIGYAGGANLYGYCGGGPVGAADPTGLWKAVVIVGATNWGEGITARAAILAMMRWLRRQGATGKIELLVQPSEAEVVNFLSSEEYEGFAYIGHGSDGTFPWASPLNHDDGVVGPGTVQAAVASRSGRMRVAHIFSCWSAMSASMWTDLSETVFAYSGNVGWSSLLDEADHIETAPVSRSQLPTRMRPWFKFPGVFPRFW